MTKLSKAAVYFSIALTLLAVWIPATGQTKVPASQVVSGAALTIVACGIPSGSTTTCALVSIPGAVLSGSNLILPPGPVGPQGPAGPAGSAGKWAADTFAVDCSASPALGCPGGTPQAVFTTSKPVAGLLMAFRAISQSEPGDYTHAANGDGTWTLTFKQPVDTGNVVLVYQTQ